MAVVIREFKNSPLSQGVDEKIAYTFNASPWTACPLSPCGVLKVGVGLSDSASNLIGAASVTSVTITTPQVASLIAGCQYRLEIAFQDNGTPANVFEPYLIINAET